MKKKLLIFAALLLVIYIGLSSFSLVKTGDRPMSNYPLSEEIKDRINKDTKGMDEMDIVDYGLKLTGELLDFNEKNNIKEGKANCVGYAQLCASITNYGLKLNKFDSSCKPVVGYVKWGGLNLCSILKTISPKKYKNFVKDHDFVEYDHTNFTIFYDPSLYDSFGTKAKTIVKK